MVTTTLPEIPTESPAQETTSLWPALPWPAIAFLILTALIAVLWAAVKLLWWDEFLVLWTAHQPRMSDVIRTQFHYPIALDPLFYHLVANRMVRLLGPGAWALRLPSLAGFLLMQICVYRFLRPIVSERAAVFALVFPALTPGFYYAVEGRPYGLLLGLCGIAMLSWQAAIRRNQRREGPLIILALSLGLVINTHYYGVLLIVPLVLAEATRALRKRRLDVPVLVALAAGLAAAVFVLPCARAAAPFRPHINFVATTRFTPAVVGRVYAQILPGNGGAGASPLQLAAVLLVVAVLLVASFIAYRRLRTSNPAGHDAEFVLLTALTLLPLGGFALALAYTHDLEPRHMIPALIGISGLAAIWLDPVLRRFRNGRLLFVATLFAVACVGWYRISVERGVRAAIMTGIVVPPEMKAALTSAPDGRIYIQNYEAFSRLWYYEPDPDLRSRFVFVGSAHEQLRWNRTDTDGLTEQHLERFPNPPPVVSWETLRSRPGSHVFITYGKDEWNWLPQAFAAHHDDVQPLGPAFTGDAVSVRFHPGS